MVLIEADKRGDWSMPLVYSETGERFSVPKNVYLLGLMNTADRSLSMVDYALRRRFAFHTLKPKFASSKFKTFLEAAGVSDVVSDKIVTRLEDINEAISQDTASLGAGFCIGHSYFASDLSDSEDDEAWYRRIVSTEIVPLLEEYWFDNPGKVSEWKTRLLD